MAQQASQRGVRYYFRLEFSSLQGKITTGFCFLGLFAVVLMAAAYWVLNPALKKSQEITTIIQPSQYQLLELSSTAERLAALAWERVKTDEPLAANELKEPKSQLSASLDSLQQLSAHWPLEESRMDLKLLQLKTNALLKKVHQLANTASQLDQLSFLEQDITPLQKNHQQLTYKLQQQLRSQQASAQAFIDYRTNNLLWVLIGSIVFATLIGAILGSVIIVSVLREIRKLKRSILELSEGKLIAPIPASRNELNSIIKALNTLTDNLRTIQEFAQEVGRGNFDTNTQVFEGQNDLGQALAGMRDSLKEVALEEKHRSWVTGGIAHFSLLLRASTEDLTAYYQHLISELVRYLGINQAALYVAEEDEYNQTHLSMKACYAYGRLKWEQKILEPGQGLAGQVFLERAPVFLQNIPKNYLQITSGLGDATPGYLAVIPLQVNESCNGVLELASFHPLEKHQLEFVLKISENISAALQHVHSGEITDRLLQEAREMASAMQMQEEMLRQNSEELIATQEKLSRDLKETNQLLEVYSNALAKGAHPQFLLTKEGQVLLANEEAQALFSVQAGAQQHISSLLPLPELGELIRQGLYNKQDSLLYTHTDSSAYTLLLQPYTAANSGYLLLQLIHQTSAILA
jgi:HAMP domain-containing protein